jgi:hypothetical protein
MLVNRWKVLVNRWKVLRILKIEEDLSVYEGRISSMELLS